MEAYMTLQQAIKVAANPIQFKYDERIAAILRLDSATQSSDANFLPVAAGRYAQCAKVIRDFMKKNSKISIEQRRSMVAAEIKRQEACLAQLREELHKLDVEEAPVC